MEVIEFGDSYEAPQEVADTVSASEGSAKKKGRTVADTTEDMQKRRNDTFGGNEATKNTKKNQLKQQYGNFKAEEKETMEQTFNRLQAIVSYLQFTNVEIEQDDLNQKFLTSRAPKWLMYINVWRNRSDLDTMSLDDLYNHLKVYEPEVIEFGDSYEAPQEVADTGSASEGSAKKKGKTVADTTEDMQKRRNDIFGGNEATKKTKKNQLKQQYGNFKAEEKETLEQTFNRLQAVVSYLQFTDVEIEQDDLNQKFLTSLAPKWLMYMIVWRNRSDLDIMSLDDLYNHLKVGRKEEVNTASFSTASTQVSPASADVATASFSHDTVYIKWNMALLSMRADKFLEKDWEKITIQGTDVAGFDKLKVECFSCHNMGHFARECRAPRSQDRCRRKNFKQGSKTEEQTPKALMVIDGVGWDWNYMANEEENHALVADEEAPTEFALVAKSSSENEVQSASKDLDTLLGSHMSDKNKEGLGYSTVPPHTQVYSSPKKDMSWTGLPEFTDDTITDYSKPSPSIESNSNDIQSSNSFVSENEESSISILSKHMIKFVNKINKVEAARKSFVRYAE
nr:hypothetical protein [Tanacetum cinerariifolium]